jgi:hypothetical protein
MADRRLMGCKIFRNYNRQSAICRLQFSLSCYLNQSFNEKSVERNGVGGDGRWRCAGTAAGGG